LKIPAQSLKNVFVSENTVKNTGKTVSGIPAAIPVKPVSVPAKPVILPSPSNPPVPSIIPNIPPNIMDLFSSLKLPPDNLSRSIIAFAHFFSLPLEPKYLNSFRKESLNLPWKGPVHREAAVLGKAAASGKGLKFDKKALNEYASAIEGSIKSFSGKNNDEPETARQLKEKENPEQQDEDSGESKDSRQENSESSDMAGGNFQNNARQEKQDKKPQGQFSGNVVKQQLTEILKNRPMLDLINRFPGKNGRWIVIPFSFDQKDFEFNVSLRILLSSSGRFPGKPAAVERLTADITVKMKGKTEESQNKEETQRQWYISLERKKPVLADEVLLSEYQVKLFSALHSPKEKEKLRNALAKALGMPIAQVEITEKPVLFSDCRDEHLRTVDEEV
jgi:hypothetical protein